MNRPAPLLITTAECEKRRHAFDLCTWINSKLLELEATGSIDGLYFERKGEARPIKKLLEEAVPASRLAFTYPYLAAMFL